MFFITTIETKDQDKKEKFKSSRCWGYLDSVSDSIKVVEENISDIYEFCYDYAVIEEIKPGIPAIGSGFVIWFKWGSGGYKKTEEPEFAKNIKNWALG